MPWCRTCDRYQLSADLKDDGGCPDCDEVIGKPHKTPWHFKLLVVAVVLYLGWRFVQMASWAIN
ncbi:MAG: hypothetical protein M3179_12350 [Actinomycetota bacterium]|nr:hypothetical protein [Actinomycetota bacterium]